MKPCQALAIVRCPLHPYYKHPYEPFINVHKTRLSLRIVVYVWTVCTIKHRSKHSSTWAVSKIAACVGSCLNGCLTNYLGDLNSTLVLPLQKPYRDSYRTFKGPYTDLAFRDLNPHKSASAGDRMVRLMI